MRETNPETARVRIRSFVNATRRDPRYRDEILAGRTIVATAPGDSGAAAPLYLEDLRAVLDAFNTPEGDDTDDPAHRPVVRVRAEDGTWFDVDMMPASEGPPWKYFPTVRDYADRQRERYVVDNYTTQAASIPLPADADYDPSRSHMEIKRVDETAVLEEGERAAWFDDRPRPLPTTQEMNDALHEQLQEDAAYELNRGFNEMNGPPGLND